MAPEDCLDSLRTIAAEHPEHRITRRLYRKCATAPDAWNAHWQTFADFCDAAGVNQTGLPPAKSDPSAAPSDEGVFYLAQLEPTLDPGRFKVGFASGVADRMRAFRCAAPFVELVKSWPCRRLWEKTVIDAATAGCVRLHTEVFRTTETLGAICGRIETFLQLLPGLSLGANGPAVPVAQVVPTARHNKS